MYIWHRDPPEISFRMKSDQIVGMKAGRDGCMRGVARVKVRDEGYRSDGCRSEGCRMKVVG